MTSRLHAQHTNAFESAADMDGDDAKSSDDLERLVSSSTPKRSIKSTYSLYLCCTDFISVLF